MIFENIKNIDVNNLESWQNKIFITFDIDWCSDEVLSYTLDIIEKYDIKVTFFITHETYLLERMRVNPNIELGVHPNFNPLLNGDFRYGKSIDEVIAYYKNIVPEAVSLRSHALTQNSLLLNILNKFNLTHECNSYIPNNSGIELKPYLHWDKTLIRVPHFWEDDLHCIYEDSWDIDIYKDAKGLKVFDFHPIHVFLNTEHLDRYESARESFKDLEVLKLSINRSSYGTKDFLIDIIKEKNCQNTN